MEAKGHPQMFPLQYVWPYHQAGLLCIPPLLYFLGGLGGRFNSTAGESVSTAWRLARTASSAVLCFSFACCCYALWNASSLIARPHTALIFSLGSGQLSFRFDLIESLMLLLVTFLGWVIVNYSRAYMAGDPREFVYIRRLMHTLAAVSLLVVTNNMFIFLIAWILTSLALHGLLTLYPNRQAAVIAAHKKFLASRLGDITLLSGVLLLWSQTGSAELDQVTDHISKLHSVPFSIHIAAILFAISAIIKCAQLPLHGWLIQVMEAPTPVSALLHAGIVNLGGFMLIRFASVLNTTPVAQCLLVTVGCLTAVIGSLVMTTRISIKVHLAWSTCAQMGFMLMECGLGLYALAFLHLLAHSVYKAHAFLGSGGTVNEAKIKSMTLMTGAPKLRALLISGVCGLIVAAIGDSLWRPAINLDATAVFCIMIAGFAIAGILAGVFSVRTISEALTLAATALAVSVLYFAYHELFQKLVQEKISGIDMHPASLIVALVLFSLLYGIQTLIRVNPLGSVAAAMYPWFYAGLYLDEVFTRATFRLWPATSVSKATQRRDAGQTFDAIGETLENA